MLTKERQVSFFSERSPEGGGIEVRDNLGIKTTAGLVDIRVNTDLLEKDILASIGRESPQSKEKAIELIGRLRVYLGKRPFPEVVIDELTSRGGVTEKERKVLEACFQIYRLIYLDSIAGVFYANEKCPFFYFNSPKIVRRVGKKRFPERLEESWLHERQHFVDFLDPVRRAQLYQDQAEIWKLFLGIDGAVGLFWSGAMMVGIYKEDKPKVTRRTFLKAGLVGIGTGAVASIAFSPFALMVSNEFTYWRGHEGERVARQEKREGILVRPFEKIFQIEFR